MTALSAPYGTGDPAPMESLADAPVRAGERRPRPCTRCGAVGTHYLTCPGLRLPPGYRLSEAGHSGERPVTGRTGRGSRPAARRSGGGPDHPDWPRPPRQ
jgi:hypothetical protein